MTGAEVKEAMFHKTPVTYNGIAYSYISAVIYRYDSNNRLMVSAELLDRNTHSVTIAKLKDVKTYDTEN